MFCEFPELWRCCFCLPLRRGVLAFSYLNITFSLLMLSLYSFWIHVGRSDPELVFHGTFTETSGEICIAVYVLEILFNIVLLYGAHARHLLCLKVFYWYAIVTVVTSILMQLVYLTVDKRNAFYFDLELLALVFAGLCIELYLIILIRTLIKKMSMDGPNVFENQLQQIVSGERKVDTNEADNPNTTNTTNANDHVENV